MKSMLVSEDIKMIKRELECSFYNGHFTYLELKEATLQSLLVHHPVIVLLCLQDACVHLARQTGHKILAITLQASLSLTFQH